MPRASPGKRLSKAELNRLRDILDPESGRRAMPIEAVDGLFACLMCSPKLAMPGEWMPLVWGGDGAGHESMEAAEEALGLLMRRYNEVAGAFNKAAYGPMVTVLKSDKGEELTIAKDCPCGSGKKYKKCCGAPGASAAPGNETRH